MYQKFDEYIDVAVDPHAEIIRRWVADLRSGNYRQCVGEMQNDGGEFCVLGVLADRQTNHEFYYDDRYALCQKIIGRDVMKTLYRMNDGTEGPPRSFSELADWIEQNLL